MKRLAVVVLFVAGLALIGCGSNSSSSNINGTWNATLMGNNNTTMFAFGTSLTASGNGNSVTVSNFSFTTNSPCFESGDTESGSFGLSGNFNGQTNGTFGMTIKSGTPAGNTLVLNGVVSGNKISGTWTLTGSTTCTGSGTFTMNKM